MSKDKPKPLTRSEVVVEAWKRLNSDSLGAQELEQIQKMLATKFGDSGVESPVSIARTLAEFGVPLRHPEVLDYDILWRDANSFESLSCGPIDFSTIEASVASLKALNSLWDRLTVQNDSKGLARLQRVVSDIREQLRLLSRSKRVSGERKKVAIEAESWLRIFLQNPQIFQDWLELRLNSVEFQRAFVK